MRLDGKTCIVTGGGGEIGTALCNGLAAHGARVMAADIDEHAAEQTVLGLLDANLEAESVRLDVTEEASWDDAISRTLQRFGRLDVLINCAGVFSERPASIADLALSEWRRSHAVNLDGALLGIRACSSVMKPGSAIVNIGSVAGYFGARSGLAYGSSKAAVRGLTLQAAAACIAEGNGIRINAVHPGYVLTEASLASGIAQLGSREAAIASFTTRSPMKRIMWPKHIVGAVVFLASDAAAMMNGTEILVDDGLSTQMPGRAF